jgi:hypothetical protein
LQQIKTKIENDSLLVIKDVIKELFYLLLNIEFISDHDAFVYHTYVTDILIENGKKVSEFKINFLNKTFYDKFK